MSLMGEAVSGRNVSVQRKEGDKLQNWGVCGCGTESYSPVMFYIGISVFPVEGEVYLEHAIVDFVNDVSAL